MKIPAFDEVNYFDNQINKNSRVVTIRDVAPERFKEYVELFISDGYMLCQRRDVAGNPFAALKNDRMGAFINYYPNIREMTVVTETVSEYFSFSDISGASIAPPQITQLPLEDFGMSYAIRLSDGRFVIIDGGREFEPDARRLFDFLKRSSYGEKPTIAAWILTHPHCDHFHCFLTFVDLFANEANIEKLLFTFPEHDDTSHYPSVMYKDPRLERDSSIYANIPQLFERIERLGVPVYSPHTGQRYVIGDAVCEILASIDDTIHRTENVNATSLIIRMELGGQVIFWGADAALSAVNLVEKYGNYIKSDILQIPHHGFQSGSASAEIAGYRVIKPKVCFLPTSDMVAYTTFSAYREGTRFLMRDALDVEEIITGDVERTLVLPYHAPAEARADIERKYLSGRYNSGSTAWFFTDLCTENEDDFVFTFINMTVAQACVWIDIMFENGEGISSIKAAVSMGMKKFSIIGDQVDGDAVYFNGASLKLRKDKIPENTGFAVRFLSDTPIVISKKGHTPAYVSPYVG